jgi:hypothetical protein
VPGVCRGEEDREALGLAVTALKPPPSAKVSFWRYVAIQRIYLARLKRIAVTGRPSAAGGQPKLVHEVWRIADQLGLSACR